MSHRKATLMSWPLPSFAAESFIAGWPRHPAKRDRTASPPKRRGIAGSPSCLAAAIDGARPLQLRAQERPRATAAR
jgi:hypothetical protein